MSMNLSVAHFAFLGLGAGLGALAVFLLSGDAVVPTPVVPERPPVAAPAPIREETDALERALRKRIRQLEAELAAARNPSRGGEREVEIRPMPKQSDFRPPNPREMMESFKKNDPKRYAEMQKRFSEMRKRQLARTKGRLDYLGTIDTAGMSAEEKANHEKLQDLLVQRENLPEFSEKMTDEEMREAGRARWRLDRAIREANEAERTTLLRQTANALGFEGENATLLTEVVQEVVRATDSDHGGFPPGPPPQFGGGQSAKP